MNEVIQKKKNVNFIEIIHKISNFLSEVLKRKISIFIDNWDKKQLSYRINDFIPEIEKIKDCDRTEISLFYKKDKMFI